MRDPNKIKYIVVHCTATNPKAKVEAIQNYWQEHLKWKNPGYHVLIDAQGNTYRLLSEYEVGNGVQGYNEVSLHVSYIGGIDNLGRSKDTRTDKQKETLVKILNEWKKKYPKARILGHRDFPNVKKDCPSFDAQNEYKNIT